MSRTVFQRGFTLIEMLVVMVIISLLVTVIMQGFGYSLGIYQRLVSNQSTVYREILAYDWLRSTLAAQVAVRPRDLGLDGSSHQLSTYTYEPLLAQTGVKTRIGWNLVQSAEFLRLEYSESGNVMAIYQWPLSTGGFQYQNMEGQWVELWPAEKSDLPALPEAVRLVVQTRSEVRNYVVKVVTRKRSDITLDEALYGH